MMRKWGDERLHEDKGYSLYMTLGLSYPDETSAPTERDVQRQVIGYILMFFYTFISLGKINRVENKLYLAAAGILSVLFGVACGFGLTLAIGIPYTMVTALAPFICLGIGIDDMFVITRCFDIVTEEEKQKNSMNGLKGIRISWLEKTNQKLNT